MGISQNVKVTKTVEMTKRYENEKLILCSQEINRRKTARYFQDTINTEHFVNTTFLVL